jgi:hypothetical protein
VAGVLSALIVRFSLYGSRTRPASARRLGIRGHGYSKARAENLPES